LEDEEKAGTEGPQMSESLQRELDEVLGKQGQAETTAPAPEEQALAEAEAKAKEYLDLLQDRKSVV
jgi:hypothetical protein